MTKFQKKVVSVIAAGAVVLSMATPAFADTTIQISGNGSGSNNAVQAVQSNSTTVSQSNTANVNNNITTNANTGGNDANYNTGGDVTVKTGDAKTTTNVTNVLNSNAATVAGCNCGSDTNVLISGNGAKSENLVTLTNENSNTVEQANSADVSNNIKSDAKTGGNDANLNTGGDVVVVTGDATANANVKTVANSNSAMIGGGAGASGSGASFKILGNGAGSDNWISAVLANSSSVEQANSANIDNDVNSDAKTGGNDAKFNTGGDVVISTGDAKAGANVDNMVNFNSASVDCGCTFDVLAKIDGNGASSYGENGLTQNGIDLVLANANEIGQANAADLDNDVYSNAKTGYNDANLNTGSVENGNDPAIITGDSTNSTDVNNSGNVNTVGGTPFVLPLPGGSSVSLSFDIQALLSFFGLSI